MIAEIGLFSLIIALLFACFLTVIPSVGLWRHKQEWILSAPYYVIGQFIFVAIAYGCLTLCFLCDDFSVTYVLANSSIPLPWFYKLCAVWGGHEGSMLLWVMILTIWMLAVRQFSTSLDEIMRARVLAILGGLSVGFILFLLATSNPFARQFQVLSTQGRDLNPLLQDPGFLFHPPMLYMGYVGFSVAFAFAISALWAGRVEISWTKWTRPWTLAAWCCLTLGISLGSWWAYRELGWGGWWFWDPVENASFMPWLVGTALIHSLAVSEKRQQFMAWTILLAITAFSLSLVGTFLVRSGVLTSVHAFAVDPLRGFYILIFLLIVIGGSLLGFAFRAQTLLSQTSILPVSRESALLLNNIFLVVAMLTVLMGTTYPLFVDSLGLGKLSVGLPYFNAVFVPLMIPLFMLMGVGIHLKWGNNSLKEIGLTLMSPFFASILLSLGLLIVFADSIKGYGLLGLMLGLWILLSTLKLINRRRKERGLNISQSLWGMIVAHCGIAVTVIGVSLSSSYGVQTDLKMSPGDQTVLAGFRITFLREEPIKGPNYGGSRASFAVSHSQNNRLFRTFANERIIYPEKRIYTIGQMAMTDSAIDITPFRDIYIALGEPLDQNAWSVRLYYKPFVRWIWSGGFFILIGGLLALTDRRYSRPSR